MKKEFQIKEPCTVGRENMQEVDGGSFCHLCSKKVHDLTSKTDKEIISLLQSDNSVCGRIQPSRLFSHEKKPKTNYNFFEFPFRKLVSGIFLAAMFSNNIYAQHTKRDTLVNNDVLDGLIVYAPRYDADYDNTHNYKPQNIILEIKFSGNKNLLMQYNDVSILTLEKRHTTSYGNRIRIREDYLGIKNIFVFENASNINNQINKNQYYTFISKSRFKDNGKTVDFNLEKLKKIEYNPRNKDFLYFLDGEEISKVEYEKSNNKQRLYSYFLTELYARELLRDFYTNYEDGIILSYTE